MRIFKEAFLKKLYKPPEDSSGEDNGQVTIIGGSRLFHGAPILSLKVASRIVDMVFFATPEQSVGRIAEKIKSSLLSFIWIPWEDTEKYIEKSDAVLIGPGFMRYGSEKTPVWKRHYQNHLEGRITREITESLLKSFPDKKWVIDAGSLQVIEPNLIPKNAIITPNRKEFELLFKEDIQGSGGFQKKREKERLVKKVAEKYGCIVVFKDQTTIVCSPENCILVKGGNPGMTKGGTGDVLAGLTVSLFAKNDAFLAASSSSYIAKKAADELYKKVGINYNANDLSEKIPEIFKSLV